jgi:oligopeptide transport system permease protein
MTNFLLRRLVQGILVLWVVATVTFALMRMTPGGPFDRERRLPPEIMANVAAKYKLDRPLVVQYMSFLSDLTRADLGPSYKYVDRSVNTIVAETLPVSLLLGLLALLSALLLSFPAGICAAFYQNSWPDRWSMLGATLGVSLPDFVLGALLIWLFSLKLGLFYVGRWGEPSGMVLPVLTLAAAPAAYLTFLLRSALLETLGEDFIRTARAKGLSESRVVVKHALRNCLIPILTVLGPLVAGLVTGSFVVEYVFAIPGMGRFYVTAVTDRDYPLIMGVTMIYTVLLVCANFLVDWLYSWADPRIRVH